jgi:hypothetical protein
MTTKHLNQIELSRRWGVSPRTLERWRWRRTGPPFMKLGGHVAYALADVEAYETAKRRPGGHFNITITANKTGGRWRGLRSEQLSL